MFGSSFLYFLFQVFSFFCFYMSWQHHCFFVLLIFECTYVCVTKLLFFHFLIHRVVNKINRQHKACKSRLQKKGSTSNKKRKLNEGKKKTWQNIVLHLYVLQYIHIHMYAYTYISVSIYICFYCCEYVHFFFVVFPLSRFYMKLLNILFKSV